MVEKPWSIKLTDAKLCEELECLLGASEEIPLMVSLLRELGLITWRLVMGPVANRMWKVLKGRYQTAESYSYKTPTIGFCCKPLFSDEGLPVFSRASGIPTVFGPSFTWSACFLFLPLLFSWWAVRASATLPSAVANSTFFRLGESLSWEKIDWKQEGWREMSDFRNCIHCHNYRGKGWKIKILDSALLFWQP